MDYFPTYMHVAGKNILVVGGTEASLHKVRLLRKTTAHVIIVGEVTDKTLRDWVSSGVIAHIPRSLRQADLANTALVYIGVDDAFVRDSAIALCAHNGIPYSVIDDKERSSFITPAIVDRDPVVVAIGTEGTGPVIARDIKARIEAELHPLTGLVAQVAGQFRPKVDHLPHGGVRRRFWQRYLDDIVPSVIAASPDHPEDHLNAGLAYMLATHDQHAHQHLNQHLDRTQDQPHHRRYTPLRIINIAAGSADLLTRRALTWRHDAALVVHHASIPLEILELSRREADKITMTKHRLNTDHLKQVIDAAQSGQQVVILVTSDIMPFDENHIHAAGLHLDHAPYIPPARTDLGAGPIHHHHTYRNKPWQKTAS